jgi:hypothetical protein
MNTPRGEMLVLSPESAFQLKLIPLNPHEFTGAGVELSQSNKAVERIRSSPEFGLRPLEESDMTHIARSLSSESGAEAALRDILGRTPMSVEDLSTSSASHILRGPVLMRPELGSLGRDISETQRSLDSLAEKTFRDRYPMRSGMYF